MKVALPARSLARPWPELLNGTPVTLSNAGDTLRQYRADSIALLGIVRTGLTWGSKRIEDYQLVVLGFDSLGCLNQPIWEFTQHTFWRSSCYKIRSIHRVLLLEFIDCGVKVMSIHSHREGYEVLVLV
jgi:hypothetical protein